MVVKFKKDGITIGKLFATQKTAIEVAGMVNQPGTAVKAIICRPQEG